MSECKNSQWSIAKISLTKKISDIATRLSLDNHLAKPIKLILLKIKN